MQKALHFLIFIIQYCFYYLITPISIALFQNKHPWIISERGDDARDNGLCFFRYLRRNHMYINAYYLIDKQSADYPRVKKYGKVVKYKSIKHWLLYRVSECRISTHLAAFAPGNFIGEYFKHHKQKGINVFTPHGINHNEYPSTFYKHNGSDVFGCGAKIEYEHINKDCGYPDDTLFFTGLPRFDCLHSFKLKNQILVMPTWRAYLRDINEEAFVKTKYFLSWNSLLSNKKLNEFLEETNMQLIFYIHYSLQAFTKNFNGFGNKITIATFNDYDVQQLLKESKLLITDYSSIFFDFAYMKKPLIYYQFDYEDFYSLHYKQWYFNHKRDGFGEVYNEESSVVDCVIESYSTNFTMKQLYKEKVESFFGVIDNNNSQRLYEAIIHKIINKKTKTNSIPTYLMFTGDDYGRNKRATIAINEAYKKGYIQQASLMVNTNNNQHPILSIPKEKVALHFNMLDGRSTFKTNRTLSYNGNSHGISNRILKTSSFLYIKRKDKIIINKEIKSQIHLLKIMGYKCIALDSHGHIHNKIPILRILIKNCKEAGFQIIRIPSNTNHNHILFDIIYKSLVTKMCRKHFITTNYFCSCYDLIHLNLSKYQGKSIEIMTHPFMKGNHLTNRRDIPFYLIDEYLSKYNVTLIDYNKLILKQSNKTCKNK